MTGVPQADLQAHFDAAGQDSAAILAQLSHEARSYAQGPAALTRAPQLPPSLATGLQPQPEASQQPPLPAIATTTAKPALPSSTTGKLLDSRGSEPTMPVKQQQPVLVYTDSMSVEKRRLLQLVLPVQQ